MDSSNEPQQHLKHGSSMLNRSRIDNKSLLMILPTLIKRKSPRKRRNGCQNYLKTSRFDWQRGPANIAYVRLFCWMLSLRFSRFQWVFLKNGSRSLSIIWCFAFSFPLRLWVSNFCDNPSLVLLLNNYWFIKCVLSINIISLHQAYHVKWTSNNTPLIIPCQ